MSLELNAKSIATAVNTFIQSKLDYLAKEKQCTTELQSDIIQHLNSNANDTFLWVALVHMYLPTYKSHPTYRRGYYNTTGYELYCSIAIKKP